MILRSYLIGLFTEEICKNIVTYGFKNKRSDTIVIKMMIHGDGIFLNIKDNCVLFDPTRYYDTLRDQAEDKTSGIGIRMIMKLSKNVTYTTGFNLMYL
ncbi:MAG: ATP-binding protein [Lachnospiraceae bacterium]|nr:ATP-binding protein [Lachnospiraceae bacterium]